MSVSTPANQSAAASDAHGEGYDAQGVARCTAAGEVVYCLVNHNYHECREGELPCCADGSGPSHSGSHDYTGAGATCLPADHPGRAPSGRPDQDSFAGELTLEAYLGHESGAEVLLQLQASEGIIKATLKTYLGYERVCVKNISVAGRRLSGGDDGNEFIVKFVARSATGSPATGELRDMLQDAFHAAGADWLTIERASVAWAEPELRADDSTEEEEDGGDGGRSETTAIVLGCALGAGALLCLGCCCYARRGQASGAPEGPRPDLEAAEKGCSNQVVGELPVSDGNFNEAAAAEGKVAAADWEASSLSTDEPPASVEGSPSEGNSLPGSPADEPAPAEGLCGTPI